MIGFEGDRKNDKVFAQINDIKFKTRKAVRETWFHLGRDLKNEANKEILRKGRTGKVYIVRSRSGLKQTRRHTASVAGESHANLFGQLRKAISWKVHGYERMDFGYGFSTTATNATPEYDISVEEGTKKRKHKSGKSTGRMDARPSIENAVRATKRNTKDHFKKAMLKEFKKVA